MDPRYYPGPRLEPKHWAMTLAAVAGQRPMLKGTDAEVNAAT